MKKTCKKPIASLSRILLLAMGGSLVLASGLSGCQTRRYNSATKTQQSSEEAGVYSACMGMQGNGVLFSSHIGTLIALFENSIDPKIIIGGSSGSIVGSIGRALMNNTSIRNTPVEYITPSGEKFLLTTPQKAALILAAAEDAMNGFLFLPGLDSFTQGKYLQYILGFAANLKAGQLPDEAHFKIMNIESTVGSAVLIVAFFQLYNFGAILADAQQEWAKGDKPNYLTEFKRRKNAMYSAFAQYTGAKQWTVAKLIGLLSDPSLMSQSNLSTLSDETPNPLDRSDNRSDTEKIQAQRLRDLIKFKTLQSEDRDFVKEPSTAEDLLEHKDMMHRWWPGSFLRLGNNALQFLNTGVQNSSKIVTTNQRDEEFKTYSNRLLNAPFSIPDPDLVMQAYQGMVPDPKDSTKSQFFPVPKGMIIHSTFRRGQVTKEPLVKTPIPSKAQEKADMYVVGFESKTGFDNLYQGYIVGESPDGSDKNAENSILNQMLDRRNNSWSDFKKSNNPFWRKPVAEVVGSNYSNAAFMLYTRGNLEGSRSSISANPVPNFKSDPPESMLPRNSDLRDDEFESYMNPNRILIFNQGTKSEIGDFRNRGLNFGIQASAGEPGAFRRYAIKWTPNDIRLNSLDGEAAVPLENLQGKVLEGFEDAQVIPFGGWGENVPLSSIAHLDECQKASIFVTSGLDAPGNDFQAGAILAALAGNFETPSGPNTEDSPSDLMSRIVSSIRKRLPFFKKVTKDQKIELSPERVKALAEGPATFQRLTAAAVYSRQLNKTHVKNTLDFNSPCNQKTTPACPIGERKQINNAIVPLAFGESRLNLAIAGYQATIKSIIDPNTSFKNPQIRDNIGTFNAFGQNVYKNMVVSNANWSNRSNAIWDRWFSAKPADQIEKYMNAIRTGTQADETK